MRRIFRTLFLAVDFAIVALFLTGYASYYVRPTAFWWFELIAVGLPYLSVLVIAAAVPLIVARRWFLVTVHAALLVLILIRANPFGRLDGQPVAGDGETLSVLTYNVPRWWGYEMPAKTAEMGELVRAADPDVIGLQEAPIEYHRREPVRRAAPYVAILFDSLGFDTIGRQSRRATFTPQPVLSKHELVRQDEFTLRRRTEDQSHVSVTRTVLRWKEREFVVYNVHLRTFGEKKPWQEERTPFFDLANLIPYLRQYREAYHVRAWEIDEIMKMVEAEELPVILCGDLNSTPNNWVHGRLSRVLRDAFAEEGRGWGMTYHTRLPVVRIDYVFVSREWEVVSARVLDAYLSDHLPLLVELRLRD